MEKTFLESTLDFAQQLDKDDELKTFRDKFYIPLINGKEVFYFAGNSLGLQPKTAQDYVLNEMENWANYGVEAHFHGRNPWANYHEIFSKKLSPIVGALPEEIVVMNQLTVNLHLLLTTFYRPDKNRFKIICEAKTFPSDWFAIESHVKLHGYETSDAVIEVAPRKNENFIRNEDIISKIKEYGNQIALVIIGGINYYTGQLFDMKAITEAAHSVGAKCGFDIAHAVGNVELHLHDWEVDFACWCSYKYLNSGPSGVAGAFIHQRYISDPSLLRLAGWWGTNKHERFQMKKEFHPIPTAEGWMISNSQVLALAVHHASLDIFEEAGFEKIIAKGKKLSAYLMFILNDITLKFSPNLFEIITPQNVDEHGCQVSILTLHKGRDLFDFLNANGVIADWREPRVIRIAPVPLYNTFEEIFRLGEIIKKYSETNHQSQK